MTLHIKLKNHNKLRETGEERKELDTLGPLMEHFFLLLEQKNPTFSLYAGPHKLHSLPYISNFIYFLVILCPCLLHGHNYSISTICSKNEMCLAPCTHSGDGSVCYIDELVHSKSIGDLTHSILNFPQL
jgi:hypothetical protein